MTESSSWLDSVHPTKHCLVTRPAHQGAQLNQMLKRAGFAVVDFPTIAIEASPQTPFLQRLNEHIASIDIALFVSRNAVDCAFRHIDPARLPADLQLGVVGKGTWQALQEKGIASHIIPAESYNSEGLLASAALQQVKGKRILIFRGQQGRTLLGDTLQARGAEVEHVEVYRRSLPDYAQGHFARLTRTHFPELAIFTSAEGLKNCFQLIDEAQAKNLCRIPWVLISERMRETARELGHNADIIIANSASDEGLLQSLQEWQHSKN